MNDKEIEYKDILFDDYKLWMQFVMKYHDLAIRLPKELSPNFRELNNKSDDKEYVKLFCENYASIMEEMLGIMEELVEKTENLQQIHLKINKEKINAYHDNLNK